MAVIDTSSRIGNNFIEKCAFRRMGGSFRSKGRANLTPILPKIPSFFPRKAFKILGFFIFLHTENPVYDTSPLSNIVL